MLKITSKLRGKTTPSTKADKVDDDTPILEKALEAMDCIMADDLSHANEILDGIKGNSTFRNLGVSTIAFVEATLGFEAEVIKDASEKLKATETAAGKDRARAIKSNLPRSSYAPGTEYYVCNAEAHLMSAVVLFLSESVIASVTSFRKLRRAYLILAEIYNNNLEAGAQKIDVSVDNEAGEEVAKEILDEAAIDSEESLEGIVERLSLEANSSSHTDDEKQPSDDLKTFNAPANLPVFRSSNACPVDQYITSGVNLCFGLLQLVISMIPPALGKVLSIIGFRGDKDTGIQMLWEASKSDNIHGALALLTLLLYYAGPEQVCDIEIEGTYPKQKLIDSLSRIRVRYPKSALWILQEARILGMHGKLEESVAMLQQPMTIQMRQIEALVTFELAMSHLDLHEFENAAKKFIRMTYLNTWSHALCRYVAGACYLELYRQQERSDKPDAAKREKYKDKAESLLGDAPNLIGRRTFIGRPIPLEVYLSRKVRKWKSWTPSAVSSVTSGKAEPGASSFLDYIVGSPANEIIYFWNGYKRMPTWALEKSLQELNYHYTSKPSEIQMANVPSMEGNEYFEKVSQALPHIQDVDEVAVHSLLQAAVLRQLDQDEAALELLQKYVLPVTRQQVKGKEDWVVPCGMYEKGVFEWKSKGENGKEETVMWLTKAANYGHDYDLSTRLGSRIQTGLEKLRSRSAA
ncbi:outer membrane protein Iml2/Tetratricopeptide repeat protein 39, partial [Lipomyces oligophaga]|uniref:outer membrane protein Iml2/Tetratricopeptide repeat protein 39 n=1 Tax=Lipomyces oligophaga TaxID=45792 RepID=UPI0034CF237D